MCLTKLTPLSKGQLSLEWLVLMAALLGALSFTMPVIAQAVEKGTNAQNAFFEQQFIQQLTTQCRALAHLGKDSTLFVNGFSPQEMIIQSRGEDIFVNEVLVSCPTHQPFDEQLFLGSFEFKLSKNT